MINPDKRKAICLLHQEGMSLREIARRLTISRNTVRSIIKSAEKPDNPKNKYRTEIDQQLLTGLYVQCNGFVQRIHEELAEKHKISIGYSTLTRRIRQLGLPTARDGRCAHVGDDPGKEMQHDTSPYDVMIAASRTRVIGSLLYLRYSKVRYLKFYRCFNRFKMQCFFHEALTHFGFTAPKCIIDNTNLARLRGSGSRAVIHPEMEEFARRYGFRFICHEIGHANRKAGNERSFYTVETNFFPGRTFESFQDLNDQALQWATVRVANRPMSKTGLIPAKAFEHEQLYLTRVPSFLEPPYQIHDRGTDQYGYAAFDGNYYWIPGGSRTDVRILEYASSIKICRHRELIAQYDLPPDGTKNQRFAPPSMPVPAHEPRNRKKPTDLEERKLRSIGDIVGSYLDFVLQTCGTQKHRFIRQLFALSGKIAPSLFIEAIARALKYKITDIETIERICLLYLQTSRQKIPQPTTIDEEIEKREAYQEGHLSEEVDLTIYDKMFDDDEDDHDDENK